MGLPFARALAPRIDTLNAELEKVLDAVGGGMGPDAQCKALDSLLSLASEALKLSHSSRHRMSATSAYAPN